MPVGVAAVLVAAVAGLPEPVLRGLHVLRDAFAFGVDFAQTALRPGMPLRGRHPVPAAGFGVVLRDTMASEEHLAKAELRLGISGLRILFQARDK